MAIVLSKKMIAICQYGGDFETHDDGSMSYIGGEAYAVDLDENMQLSGFKQEIAETIDSTVDAMIIKYFLPGNKKNLITVSKDKDFQRMVSYYKEADQLEVFIMKEAPPGKNARKSSLHLFQFPQNPFPMVAIENDQRIAARQWENLITGVGQRFHSLAEFREALRKYSIAHAFNFVYKKNENQRVTVKCKAEGCPWRIHASKLSTTQLVCIKTMRPVHNCQGVTSKAPFGLKEAGTKEDSSFHRLFVCFHASVSGFLQGCRPLLFLDGTPLNSRYQGMLLTATAAMVMMAHFVAFAVVDEENDDNGIAEKLNKDLKGHFSHDARRLMVEDLYAAAHAPKLEAFEKCTEDIKAISPEAYNVGEDDAIDLHTKSRVESMDDPFNTPSMEEKLKNEIIKARSVQVLRVHGSKFEVRYGEMIEIVDIENWDCSCKGWLLTGCLVVMLLLFGYILEEPVYHCSRYFHVEMYHLTYADSIHPIPNVERLMDSETEDGVFLVTPPPTMRTPGRTKIRKIAAGRIGPSDFLKRQLQCGKCKGLGHNKRSCK
ncbi:hypothetical protein E3N88_32338 [Mikania micrantha]|uniref:PB1 domain-containing protein n=1 Tax=Mikania micrantha TaxID=192012 RepID=A0A5N6M860_9ASTR|nr:hypothetical protein E3N88_32338 [Mikania micrantha]